MSKENKITEEQLQSIKESQEKIYNILAQVGGIEAQKQVLLFHQSEAQKELEDFKKTLQEEYGDINIDMKDGSFTVLEQKDEAELKSV
tara:strand:+ start:603 stop:866 length:264 start_codon:yes stop_codon:yes gene_type:complete